MNKYTATLAISIPLALAARTLGLPLAALTTPAAPSCRSCIGIQGHLISVFISRDAVEVVRISGDAHRVVVCRSSTWARYGMYVLYPKLYASTRASRSGSSARGLPPQL